MSGTRQCQFSTVIYISVLAAALFVNKLSAQNAVHFYTSSPSVSTTEHPSIVVEQSEVASGRSIRGGSFRQTNNNLNERPLRTTGFAFKGRNGDFGQTSPIPFLIPSYASGIIFRNSDNDNSPQVEIQPSIHIASKTIGPDGEIESVTTTNGHIGFDFTTRRTIPTTAIPTTTTTTRTTTPNTFRRTRPTQNVNLVNSFERKTFTPLQTTSFRPTFSVTQQPAVVQNEIQNISPIRTVSTTLSPPQPPLIASQIHTRPTIDRTTQQPRFSDITKRIDVLGLQSPGYAIRSDGTIDSDALPPNFVITHTNFASNNLNPLDFDTTTQMIQTTTPRIARTTTPTQFQFIPSNDNPFLSQRKSKQQNLNATPSPFTSFQSNNGGFTTFATTVNNINRNQHGRGNAGFTTSFAPQTSANSSPFSKSGIKTQNSPNAATATANGQFVNQLNSRQSKNYNELSFNSQQHKNPQIVLNLDNRARLPAFGIPETTTTSPSSSFGGFTTKRVQSFANNPIPTAKAPAGFSFAAKTTPRPRIVPTTNGPTTFSTIFPSKYAFSTIPTTVAPHLAQSEQETTTLNAIAPSVELLPPISSNAADAKSAFAPINEAGALIRTKSPAFSPGAANRNQQQLNNNNNIKPQKANNGFATSFPITTTRRPIITTTAKAPIRQRPTFSTTFKFTTTTQRPTTTTTPAAAIITTLFPAFGHQNQPNVKAQAPFTDLLPPIDSDSQSKESSIVPSTNTFEHSSSAINLPNNDLLPPLSSTSDLHTQNSPLNSIPSANKNDAPGHVHTTTQSATGIKTQNDQQQKQGLDLNPFLPPVDEVSKSPSISANVNHNTNSENNNNNNNNNNEYTTITLEQNPFLPQLDLNPFLPPFVFTPSENDPGFGFGAGTPPPKDEDDDTNAS